VAHWLLKEEPAHYSWADLARDGSTDWDGVHNALALRHLRTVRVGDDAIFYHTGDERACVGLMEVVSPPAPDPHDERGSWRVRVRAVRELRRPISLAEIKGDPSFAGFELVRFGRLSVVPVSDAHWKRLMTLEGSAEADAPPVKAARKGPARSSGRRTRRRAAKRTR
jgi:predicted RNA-binding protein with PUA-like domain